MKIRSITLLLFLISFIKLNAQSTLEGIVVDAKNNTPLIQVNIFNQTSVTGNSSNLDGTFKIQISKFPTILIFSYVGYENYLLEIKEPPTAPLSIPLRRSSFGLPEIEITAKPKIKKLTKDTYSVRDFIIDHHQILILTHGGIGIGNKLLLQNWEGKILFELNLGKEKVTSLQRSCLGSIHLLGKKFGFEISLLANQIQLVSKYPVQEFEDLMRPCVAASKDFLYWKNYRSKNQLLTYSILSKKGRYVLGKINVVDELNLSRSRYDFVLQNQLAEATGFGKPTPTEIQSWNQMMYKPLFCPLFSSDSAKELYLFNHINDYLEFYSLEGKIKRFLPITYHKNKKWERQILFDKKNNKVYTVFENRKGKAIHEIKLVDGTTQSVLYLECEFIEKMEIYDGILFYTESGRTEVNRDLNRVPLGTN